MISVSITVPHVPRVLIHFAILLEDLKKNIRPSLCLETEIVISLGEIVTHFLIGAGDRRSSIMLVF